MFSYDPSKRPTIEELKSHPWMQMGLDVKESRSRILTKLHENRSEKTATSSKDDGQSRADFNLELVKQVSAEVLDSYRFNDQTDFDITCAPDAVFEALETWNADINENQAKIEKN